MTNHPINPLTNKSEDIEAQVRAAFETTRNQLFGALPVSPVVLEVARMFHSMGYIAAYEEGTRTLSMASELIHRKHKEKMDAQAARIAELDATLTCQREARDAWKEDYRETKTKLATSEQRAAAFFEVYERASELTRGPSMAVAPADYRRAFSALTIACIAARAALAAGVPSAASTEAE